MSGLLRNRYVVLAKVESTEGTDPTPTNSADAILVENLQVGWPTEVLDRNLDIGSNSLSAFQPIHGRKYGTMSFDVELKGSGAAGTAADWDPLAQACGLDPATVASTSVTYTPISSGIASITLYAYRDGLLYELNGARGNVTFRFPAGQRPMMSFEFQGIAVDAVDAAIPTPTLDSTVPVPVTGASFTAGSYAAVVANLELNLGNQLTVTDDLNAATGYGRVLITGRDPLGSFDPEATLVATNDWWSKWEDGTVQELTLAVTGSAGNIATFTMSQCYYRELSEGERNGVLTYEIPFTAARSSGDDELSLAMT